MLQLVNGAANNESSNGTSNGSSQSLQQLFTLYKEIIGIKQYLTRETLTSYLYKIIPDQRQKKFIKMSVDKYFQYQQKEQIDFPLFIINYFEYYKSTTFFEIYCKTEQDKQQLKQNPGGALPFFQYAEEGYADWFDLLPSTQNQIGSLLNQAQQYLQAAQIAASFVSQTLKTVGSIYQELKGGFMNLAEMFISKKSNQQKTMIVRNVSGSDIRVLMIVLKFRTPVDNPQTVPEVELLDSSTEGILSLQNKQQGLSTSVKFSWQNGQAFEKYHSNQYYLFIGHVAQTVVETPASLFIINGFVKENADRLNDSNDRTIFEYQQNDVISMYQEGREDQKYYGRLAIDPKTNVIYGFKNPKLQFQQVFEQVSQKFNQDVKQLTTFSNMDG